MLDGYRLQIVVALSVCLASAAAVAGQENPYEGAERYTGRYVWVGGDDEQQQRLAAIEDVVIRMNRIIRRAARRRLTNGTHISSTYEIQVDGDQVTIGIDDGRAWTTPLDGTPVDYAHEGEAMTMSRTWVRGTIHAVGKQRVGTGTYDFRLSEDGRTLHVRFSMDSGVMPEPVVFDTTYRRAE